MISVDVIRAVAGAAADEPIIASLGHPAYELFAAGDRPANFYTWGSMGLASSIGLGLALAKKERRVYVLDGDGSLLMNLGSLATIGWQQSPNLVVIVLDNSRYATTGGQETATAHGTDLEAVARAMGVKAVTVRSMDAVADALGQAKSPGPWAIIAKVEESRPAVKPPLDCVFIKQRFMRAMGCAEAATMGGGT